ncbi:MAG: YraN family protein [Bacteroidia bacterium]|nr:YraN family protein [Bacteroidia bacterium]
MLTTKELGKKGEDLAVGYLKKNGYQILARNWHFDHKEIDIIAKQQEELVILEVKTREGDYFEEPWEAISVRKIRNLVEAADAWILEHKSDATTRFDVVSIVFSNGVTYELKHFEGAFIPPVN